MNLMGYIMYSFSQGALFGNVTAAAWKAEFVLWALIYRKLYVSWAGEQISYMEYLVMCIGVP